MNLRQPVLGDHLRERGFAQHQFRVRPVFGSTDTAAIVGAAAARSTTTSPWRYARSGAPASARCQVMQPLVAVPIYSFACRAAGRYARVSTVSEPISVNPAETSERVSLMTGAIGGDGDSGGGLYRGSGLRGGSGYRRAGYGGQRRAEREPRRTAAARRRHAQQFAGCDGAGAEHQRRQRRDQHDRQLLRVGRGVGTVAREMITALRPGGVDISRGWLHGYFAQDRISEDRAAPWLRAQPAQFDIAIPGRGRLAFQLVEAGTEAFDPATGDARVILERAGDLARLFADLAVEVGKLRLQLLDARMTVEQRR